MDGARVGVVRSNAAAIGCKAFELADLFLQKLWSRSVELRRMFPGEHVRQRRELIQLFSWVSKNLANLDAIEQELVAVGRRNAKRGVTREHCLLAKDALLESLKEIAGPHWNHDIAEAWASAITIVFDAVAPTHASQPALAA